MDKNFEQGGNCWGRAVYFMNDHWGRLRQKEPGAFVYMGRGRVEKISDLDEGSMYGRRAYLKDGKRIRCYDIRANPPSLLERCKDLAAFFPEKALDCLPVELREAMSPQ